MPQKIKHIKSDGVEISIIPVAAISQPMREAEREAVSRLVEAKFGSGAVLTHSAAGAPLVDGVEEGRVSVSHGAGYAALAVCDAGRRVGIDVESPREQLRRVVRRILTPAEAEILPDAEACDIALLLRIWTAKEAVYKLTPDNATLTLSQIRLLSADHMEAWRSGDSVSPQSGMTIRFIALPGDALLAVATAPRIRRRGGRG